VYDNHDRLRYTFFPNASNGAHCTLPSALPAGVESGAPVCAASGGTTPTYEDLWYTTNGAATGPLCSGNDQVCRKRTRGNQTLTYTYDAMNRMATKAPQNLPTVTTTYNLRSEPTLLTTPAGSFTSGATSFTIPAHSIAYDYDDAGRKLFETSDGFQVSYGYDGAGGQSGNRTRTVWPDGYRVSYAYDALNRMSTVWEGLPNTTQLADYRYDALQRRQRLQYANQANHRVDYTYESGRLHLRARQQSRCADARAEHGAGHARLCI